MKKIYQLKLMERDDYFYMHDTLVCEILEIDEKDKKLIEEIRIENGIEIYRNVTIKFNIDTDTNAYYFNTLNQLKSHLEKNYEFVKKTKYHFLFLSVEDMYNSVVSIRDFESNGLVCSKNFINLQKLLDLNIGC